MAPLPRTLTVMRITYSWAFVQRPSGSAAALLNANTASPSFTVDIAGRYRVRLTVNDGQVSGSDEVDVTTVNVPPVANAGPDQTVHEGDVVTLNGSGSSDQNGNDLSYQWSFVSRPQGSTAQLSAAGVVAPTFTADVAGVYTLQLIVNDTIVDGAADTVVVTALSNHVMLALVNTPLVGVGTQAGVRVLLPFEAPPGGVTVSLTSSNPVVATVSPSSVTIAAGENQASCHRQRAVGRNDDADRCCARLRRRHAGHLRYEQHPFRAGVVDRAAGGHNDASGDHLEPRTRWWAGGVAGQQQSRRGGTPLRHDHDSGRRGCGERDDPGESAGDRHCRGELAELCQRQRSDDDPGKPEHHGFVDSDKTGIPEHGDGRVAERRESGCCARTRCSGVVRRRRARAVLSIAAVTIPTGLTSATAAVTYGGSATLPCTTTVNATAPDLTGDSISVTVNPNPGITLLNAAGAGGRRA